MKKKLILFLLLLLFILFLMSVWISRKNNQQINGRENSESLTGQTLSTSKFFDPALFDEGITIASRQNTSFSEKVGGGIVPHHLLASHLIADFFSGLSQKNYKTLILLGPNHDESGGKILTSSLTWDTPFGSVMADTEIVSFLLTKNIAQEDLEVFGEEHSLATLIPFIKFYLPDTRVVPIILRKTTTKEELVTLAEVLKNFYSEEKLIITSIDFSHYLNSEQAKSNDKVTLKYMQTFDYEKLLNLSSDYIDSPPSIVGLLMTMQKIRKTKMKVIENTNSGEILNDKSIPSTSYFSIIYY